MRATRRRRRTPDPLANPQAVRSLLVRLRELHPQIIPQEEKRLIKMLAAIRNVERRPATDTRRGRPSHWKRHDLVHVAVSLRCLLERETNGRVSLNSFLGLYIRVLDFPEDITDALASNSINLFEAAQLARMRAKRLNLSLAEARARRSEVLCAHLLAQGSSARLRARVNEQLGGNAVLAIAEATTVWGIGVVDNLLELDLSDTRHLFWEELRRIAFAIHSVTPEDVDDKMLDDLLPAIDHLSAVLSRIDKRRQYSGTLKLGV